MSRREFSLPDILYGNMNLVINGGLSRLSIGSLRKMSQGMSLNHPTCFVSRKLYRERLFDTRYKIAADYELMLSHKFDNRTFVHVNEILVNMRSGGISENNRLTMTERFDIQAKYYSHCHAFLYMMLFVLKRVIRDSIGYAVSPRAYDKIRGYR